MPLGAPSITHVVVTGYLQVRGCEQAADVLIVAAVSLRATLMS
jgi:hypothetical protein